MCSIQRRLANTCISRLVSFRKHTTTSRYISIMFQEMIHATLFLQSFSTYTWINIKYKHYVVVVVRILDDGVEIIKDLPFDVCYKAL
jgi:hypothetical protein